MYLQSNRKSSNPTAENKPKDIYVESKMRIGERIGSNVNSCGSLVRQVIRGSRSNEILAQAARNFASQEHQIESVDINLRKMQSTTNQLNNQLDQIRWCIWNLKTPNETIKNRCEKIVAVSERLDRCLQ